MLAAVLCLAIATVSCGQATPEYHVSATVKDIMDSFVDPSADEIWESIATEITLEGEKARQPSTDEEWRDLRRSAIRIIEATDLLLMPGRLVARPGEKSENPEIELEPEDIARRIHADVKQWTALAKRLHEAASESLRAIDERNVKSLFDSGDRLDAACENCHKTYWYPADAAKTPPSRR
jgi:hypothetical protein